MTPVELAEACLAADSKRLQFFAQFESMPSARASLCPARYPKLQEPSLKSLSTDRRCRPLGHRSRFALPLLTAAAASLGTLLASGHALGQDVEHGTSVQRFQPAPGPRNYFTMRGARTDGEKAWSAGLMVNYAFEPLTVQSCRGVESCR
jgi:hypothetical protein